MYWLESFFIIAGISFDMFAALEIEGAMLAKIKPRFMLTIIGLVLMLQIGFFVGGYAICYAIKTNLLSGYYEEKIASIIAMVMFGLLGVRLIIKAIKNDNIEECRKDISTKKYAQILLVATIYTLFIGFAQGLMGGSILYMLIVFIICMVFVVIGGIFTGYRYGYKLKSWVYGFGAGLLWALAVEILMTRVL